ncbi:MAG TPA: hypothetical protein VES42_16810, partial [Pilimelia sp.]|nr:hypothetical protein [Pilimelia sp.]
PVADQLGIELVRCEPLWTEPDGHAGAPDERIGSRLMKIEAIAEARFDPVLYLDCDTLVLDDIGKIVDELGPALADGADMFSLLRRPTAPTLWDHRSFYFPNDAITKDGAADLLHDIYGVAVTPAVIDELVCWNSGIIFGRSEAVRGVARRWLELYRRMLASPRRAEIVPRDQLGFWITLWELRSRVRVRELPARWNFMAGYLPGLDSATAELPDGLIGDAAILHFAGLKFEPWALRRVLPVLAAVPGAPALWAPAGAAVTW